MVTAYILTNVNDFPIKFTHMANPENGEPIQSQGQKRTFIS